MRNRIILLSLCCFLIVINSSCVSIKIELEPPSEKPVSSFTVYHHYGLLGLVGSPSLNLPSSCIDSTATKIKNYFSFEDTLFALITLGLYSPKSTTIWCQTLNTGMF